VCHGYDYVVLVLGVFKGTVGFLSGGFPFFLLLSLHNLLYTIFYTLVSSCSPSIKSWLR
jgi:hypothetical protein